jgi:hypothetical protein
MLLTDADQRGIHAHCSRHRAAVLRSRTCGCFYCGALFSPTEILDWVDVPPDSPPDSDAADRGTTALCPRCGIDAVLPDSVPGASLSVELLAEMQAFWF